MNGWDFCSQSRALWLGGPSVCRVEPLPQLVTHVACPLENTNRVSQRVFRTRDSL